MNPFVRYGLEPHQTPRELTEQLRERLEDATSEAERDELRAAWELLTKKPTERAFLSLEAGPDVRPPAGSLTTRRQTAPEVPPLDVFPITFGAPAPPSRGARLLALTDPVLASYEPLRREFS